MVERNSQSLDALAETLVREAVLESRPEDLPGELDVPSPRFERTAGGEGQPPAWFERTAGQA